MAAFQFPDPAVTQTVTNPITGSTYQWKADPGKWVVTVSMQEAGALVWEGDSPPDPIGDYKLWYNTDLLELNFYYCDVNGVCAWVPTSVPIKLVEDLDEAVAVLRTDVQAVNIATLENENRIGRTIFFSDIAPVIYDDEVYDGVAYPNELNYKFWYDTARLELLILFRDEDGDDSYLPVSIPLESLPEPGVSTETFTYTTGRLQTAIEENYLHNLNQDAALDDRVKKTGGDDMEGPLVMRPQNNSDGRATNKVQTLGVFSNSDGSALRLGTTRDRVYVGHNDLSINGPVKLQEVQEKNAGQGIKVSNKLSLDDNQIKDVGLATEDADAVTYGQVKEELEELRDKIVGEVSLGTWKFDNISSGVTPVAGCFITKKDSSPPQLSPNDINNIRISDEDINGNPGVFDWEIGDLLTFTNVTNTTQSIKFRVNGTPANSGTYWIINVAHVTSNYDFFQNAEYYLSHINIDAELDVGTLDDTYLRLDVSNGPLTNNLTIDKSADGPSNGGLGGKETTLTLRGDRTTTTNSACTITFDNASSEYTGYLTYRSEKDGDTAFFKFNRDLEIVGALKTNNISTRSGDVTTFDKKLDFTSTELNARFQKGFVIKKDGQAIDGTNIFTAYNDFVEYDGPTDSDKRIANRKWIWDNTVRDYNINSNWGLTAGQYINSNTYGKVNNPGGSLLNKHNYEFLISASGYGSFYVIGNDACVRNNLYVNSLAENSNPKGNRVATVSTSRSMMSGMRQAILGATDFEDLKLRLLAKLEEMENSNEFSDY